MINDLAGADHARLSLPQCGSDKEVSKGLKLRRSLGRPGAPNRRETIAMDQECENG